MAASIESQENIIPEQSCACAIKPISNSMGGNKMNSASMAVAPLELNETLRKNTSKLYQATLVPIDCSFSLVRDRPEQSITVKDMVRKERKHASADVTLIFAVRNVGCGGCREHGMQLTQLAEEEKIGLVGVVKETGVDDEGLLDFYQNYFHWPIYKDVPWNIYHSMGSRKASIFKVVSAAGSLLKRLQQKKIKNKVFKKGDVFMQGGVLLFDKKGELCYAVDEDIGEELDIERLRAAIASIRNKSHRRSSASETDYSENTMCS